MQTDQTLEQIAKAKPKRLGILGGTFDPIHNEHLRLAQAAMEEFSLDEALLLVSGDPPHKTSFVDKEQRFEMAARATAGLDRIHASRLEIDRTGVTYTVDSLKQVRSALGGEVELYYIVGGDTLAEIPHWREYEEVMSMTNLIVFSRQGMDDDIAQIQAKNQLRRFSSKIFFGAERLGEVSSTAIRKRSAQGLSLHGLVPHAVEEYIREHAIYAGCALSFEQCAKKVEAALTRKRYRHTLGVIDMAQDLARRFGADVAAARWAGLLHDCAKKIEDDEAMAMCLAWNVELDDIVLEAPKLIHGPLGAELARREYGMEDEEVLDAIRYHSTGKPAMSLLCKIIYLADMIEPGREFSEVKAIRALAQTDLDSALRIAMDLSIRYVLEQGEALHPLTVYARNALLQESRQ